MRDSSRQWIMTALIVANLTAVGWNLSTTAVLIRKHGLPCRPCVLDDLHRLWDRGHVKLTVSLMDLSTAHDSCGADCELKGVGR